MTWEELSNPYSVLIGVLLYSRSELLKVHRLEGMKTLVRMREAKSTGGYVTPIEAYNTIRVMKVTNPRDMFYGLLGLLDSGTCSNIEPKYDASVSEVFRDASRALILSSGNLVALSHTRPILEIAELPYTDEQSSQTFEEQLQDLPRWAADWTPKQSYDLYYSYPSVTQFFALDDENRLYDAKRGQPIRSPNSTNRNVLKLSGRLIGTLTTCCRSFQYDAMQQAHRRNPNLSKEIAFFFAWMLVVVEMQNRFSSSVTYAPTGETNSVAQWKTIVGDRFVNVVTGEVLRHPPPAMEGWIGHWD